MAINIKHVVVYKADVVFDDDFHVTVYDELDNIIELAVTEVVKHNFTTADIFDDETATLLIQIERS